MNLKTQKLFLNVTEESSVYLYEYVEIEI